MMNIPADVVESMMVSNINPNKTGKSSIAKKILDEDESLSGDEYESAQIESMLTSFQGLDESFRGAAGADDAKRN